MACRRGRILRWPAHSPYASDARSRLPRSTPSGCSFADVGVEVLLDWPHSDRSLPPPSWLIAESRDAYAFTVQRPGEVGISADDVEVQIERRVEGDEASSSEGDEDEAPSSSSPSDDHGPFAHQRHSGIGASTNQEQCSVQHSSVTSLLTIFCERLFNTGQWHPSCQPDHWSSTDPSCLGLRNQPQQCHHGANHCENFQNVQGSASDCDCLSCSRKASGVPWKFGRRFSLPGDASVDKAVAAQTNGAVTVIVPRSKLLWQTWSQRGGGISGTDGVPRSFFSSWRGAGTVNGDARRSCNKRWLLQVATIPPGTAPADSSQQDRLRQGMYTLNRFDWSSSTLAPKREAFNSFKGTTPVDSGGKSCCNAQMEEDGFGISEEDSMEVC